MIVSVSASLFPVTAQIVENNRISASGSMAAIKADEIKAKEMRRDTYRSFIMQMG
jgi:hypothetical protein